MSQRFDVTIVNSGWAQKQEHGTPSSTRVGLYVIVQNVILIYTGMKFPLIITNITL